MICMDSISTIEELNQIIKDILKTELPTITLDFSPLPTWERFESNTPIILKIMILI